MCVCVCVCVCVRARACVRTCVRAMNQVGSIHACDMVATLKLLVAMIRHFSPKTRLPPGELLYC